MLWLKSKSHGLVVILKINTLQTALLGYSAGVFPRFVNECYEREKKIKGKAVRSCNPMHVQFDTFCRGRRVRG